jgi:hypothetical protein
MRGGLSVAAFSPGKTLLTIFECKTDYPFLNFAKCSDSLQSTGGFAFPSVLDANQYPNNVAGCAALSTTVFQNIYTPASYTGKWRFGWSGSQGSLANPGLKLAINGVTTFSVVSGSGFVASSGTNLQTYGAAGAIVFTNSVGVSQFTFSYLSGALYGTCVPGGSALANVTLCQVDNGGCAALDAGQVVNPDYLTSVRNINSAIIRTLAANDVNDSNNFTGFCIATAGATGGCLQTPDAGFSYAQDRWDPTVWAGTAVFNNAGCNSGTDSYAVTLAGAALTDGQTVQLQFPNTNASTTPVVCLNGGSPFAVQTMAAAALTTSAITANGVGTLVYDALRQKWLWAGNRVGITAYTPLSFQVALANALGMSLWYNWPPHITDASVTAMGTAVKAALRSNIVFRDEYANEVWNFTFQQTSWAVAMGATLGFPAGNNRQYHGFYALRRVQITNLLAAVWGSQTNWHPVLAFQAFGDPSATDTYRIQGSDLSGSTYSAYCSYVGGTYSAGANPPATATCTGDPGYNVQPNRPIDGIIARNGAGSFATYYNGAVLAQATGYGVGNTYAAGDLATCSVAGTNSGGLRCAADNYALGTAAAITASFAWIDNDIRAGTQNGVLGQLTLLNYSTASTGIYAVWNTIAASYGLPVINYEGAYQGIAPTAGQCALGNININSSYCGPSGTIQTALNAYKANYLFYKLVSDQFNQMVAGSPAGSAPAWFLNTDGVYALLQGDIYSTPNYSWYAVKDFNTPYLLNRDLDPASNDNTPAFMDKAA